MNYELILGRSGEAVGLSAISFSATLQKDAASIPNALAAIRHQWSVVENWKFKIIEWKFINLKDK